MTTKHTSVWVVLLALLITPFLSNSQVIINEFSCSNTSTILDNFNDNEDWIELHNTSGSPFDLTGYYLSDKASNLTKWQIPSGTVPANGYMVVMCSGRNTVQGGELHQL